MNTGKKDSENVLFKDFDEVFDNKKEEKKEAEKTGLNKDNIPIIDIPTKGDIIVLINNSDFERIERSRKRPKYSPIEKRNVKIQTDSHQSFSDDEYLQVNEPKSSPAENGMKNITKNKFTALIQKISEVQYLGRKTKSNKNQENINQIKANVNKDNINNTCLKIGNNINNNKLSLVNNTINEHHEQNNYNYNNNYNSIIEKNISNMPNLHDSHDFLFLQEPLDFHEEQRISQKNLKKLYGY